MLLYDINIFKHLISLFFMYKPESYLNQLAEYILKNLKKGYTQDSLKYSLISQGYSKISVDNAIGIANKQLAETAPEMKEKPQITYKIIDEQDKVIEVTPERKKSWLKRIYRIKTPHPKSHFVRFLPSKTSFHSVLNAPL